MSEQFHSTETCDFSALKGMLRAELAAVETYNLAINHLDSVEIVVALERIRDEHLETVNALRLWVQDLHQWPLPSGDAWGMISPTVVDEAKTGGESTLLAVLKRAERQGESTYRQELGNPDLPDEIRHFVGAKLLPRCQQHLAKLEHIRPN